MSLETLLGNPHACNRRIWEEDMNPNLTKAGRRYSCWEYKGSPMAGVKQLLKQAQKMQQKMNEAQAEIAKKEFEVSSGGGAVVVKVNGNQDIISLRLDPDFLKEESTVVEEAILQAIREAMAKAKSYCEAEMNQFASGFHLPGLM